MKRAIVLVLDGFGVGEMPDVVATRPQDHGAHTLGNILRENPAIKLPNLEKIGALDYFVRNTFKPRELSGFLPSFGKMTLAHFGADSYMGHQEISGTNPQMPVRQFVRDIYENIIHELSGAGFKSVFNGKYLVVDEHIAIADNIETDYGLNINVVGSLDHYPYETIEKVGRIVRGMVQVGRVITMGGVGVTQDHFANAFEIKNRDGYTAWGINIPKLKIYTEEYRVIHMGYGINPETQTPQLLRKKNVPVVLIGKTADVIVANGATYIPEVQTHLVLQHILDAMKSTPQGFIFANVQQTDLSGHEEDVPKYSKYLEIVDHVLPEIINRLKDDDIFIITGDHGNDPTIGHTNHTREYTPLMFFSKQHGGIDFGKRKTLADIGATVAKYLGGEAPEAGMSLI